MEVAMVGDVAGVESEAIVSCMTCVNCLIEVV